MCLEYIKWPSNELTQQDGEADEEYVWRKLSTLPKPECPWQGVGAMGFRHGELSIMMAGRGTGKTVFSDIETSA